MKRPDVVLFLSKNIKSINVKYISYFNLFCGQETSFMYIECSLSSITFTLTRKD
jgi:hypothetical protein